MICHAVNRRFHDFLFTIFSKDSLRKLVVHMVNFKVWTPHCNASSALKAPQEWTSRRLFKDMKISGDRQVRDDLGFFNFAQRVAHLSERKRDIYQMISERIFIRSERPLRRWTSRVVAISITSGSPYSLDFNSSSPNHEAEHWPQNLGSATQKRPRLIQELDLFYLFIIWIFESLQNLQDEHTQSSGARILFSLIQRQKFSKMMASSASS